MKPVWIGEVPSQRLGPIWVAVSDLGLAAVEFADSQAEFTRMLQRRGYGPVLYDSGRTEKAADQIADYLAGKRHTFDLEIDWSGLTAFQKQALQVTFAIPYGQLMTYGEIAAQIGRPRSARAVGRAEATNPMPLVIPCHRVVGADGSLHGYGGRGGLETKSWLISMEQGGAPLAPHA
jgi:methylated-DNA-[protein]-cysteine S-methyltransferase